MDEEKEIKIIETRRALSDITSASTDALEVMFEELSERLPEYRGEVLSFIRLAEEIQRDITNESAMRAMPEIIGRSLLSFDDVIPLIERKVPGDTTLAVRPRSRKGALMRGANGDILPGAIAAEESVPVVALYYRSLQTLPDATTRSDFLHRLLWAVLWRHKFAHLARTEKKSATLPAAMPVPRTDLFTTPNAAATSLLLRFGSGVESELAGLAELDRNGAMPIYLRALTEGRESESVKSFFEQLEITRSKADQFREIEAKNVQERNKALQLAAIVADKFGSARIKNAARSKDILRLLSSREREVVVAEYKSLEQFKRAMINNKCPHIKVLKRLRGIKDNRRTIAALRELLEYSVASGRKKDSWITCKLCNFAIICPHEVALIQMEAKRESYDAIRVGLRRFVTSVRQPDADSFTYFCRICGGRLGEIVEQEEETGSKRRFGNLDEMYRSFLWPDAARIVEKLIFEAISDPKHFVALIIDAVAPLVIEASGRKARSTARSAPRRKQHAPDGGVDDALELEPALHLDAVLLIHAFALNLIDQGTGTAKVGLIGVKPGVKTSVYAKTMLEDIVSSYGALISRIEDITPEFLTTKFAEAFRTVRGEVGDIRLRAVDPETEIATQVVELDPVYHYAAAFARSTGALPIVPRGGDESVRKEFETVLGTSLTDLVKSSRKLARDPELAPLFTRKMVIDIPRDTTLELFLKDPRINLFSGIYRYRDKGKNKIAFMEEPQGQSLEVLELGYRIASYNLFVEYTTALHEKQAVELFQEHLEQVKSAEKRFLEFKSSANLPPIASLGFSESLQFSRVAVPLGLIFDEAGIRHRWTWSAIAPAGKCSICGVAKDAASALDESKIRRALEIATKIDMFFAFYEMRCPLGDVHSFTGGKCTRCDLIGGEKSRDYFDKYEKAFEEQKQTLRAEFVEQFPPPPSRPDFTEWAAGWKPDFGLIVRAAEIGGTTSFAIEAIGATEHRDFASILAGKEPETSIPPEVISDPRLPSADAAVRRFAAAFMILRGVYRQAIPVPNVTEILDKAGIRRVEYEHLTAFPNDILNSYGDKRAALVANRSPADVYRFSLEQLCRMVVGLHDGTALPHFAEALRDRRLAAVAQEFAKSEFKAIMRGEMLMSKPGAFDFAIFSEAPLETAVETGWDSGDVGEDVLEMLEVAADEEKNEVAFDPFSYEHMDYDGDNEDGDAD